MTFVQMRLGRKRWGLLVDHEQAIISDAPKVWPTMSYHRQRLSSAISFVSLLYCFNLICFRFQYLLSSRL